MADKDKLVNLEDLKVVGDEVSVLKSAFGETIDSGLTVERTFPGWVNGYIYTPTGTEYVLSGWNLNRNTFSVADGVMRVTADEGHTVRIFAWNKSGTCVGTLKTDGTFSTSGTNNAAVTEFNCTLFPDYVFRMSTAGETAAAGDYIKLHYSIKNNLTYDKNNVDFLYDYLGKGKLFDFGEWISGGYDGKNYVSNTARLRINKTYLPKGANLVFNANGQEYYYFVFDTDGFILSYNGWLSADRIIVMPADGYLGVMIRKTNGSTITVSERTFSIDVTIPYVDSADVDAGGLWVQGGLDGASETTSNTRIRMNSPVEIRAGDVVRFYPNGQYYKYALYDSEGTYQSFTADWSMSYAEYNVKNDGYIRVMVANNPVTDTIRPYDRKFSFTIGTALENKITDAQYNGKHLYGGEKINFGLHGFSSGVAFTIPAIADIQGVAYYDGKYFAWLTDGTINVYDYKGALITNFNSTLPADGVHGNTLQFANVLHDGNTQYPYLLVGQTYFNGHVFVLDIAENNGTYTATQAGRLNPDDLSTDVTGAGNIDYAVDFANNHIYLVRYEANTTAGQYKTHITQLAMPELTGENYRFKPSDILDSFVVDEYIYARQQTVYHNGKIYMTAGGSTVTGKARLYVIDCMAKGVSTIVDIGAAMEYNEPEALIIRDNDMLVFTNYAAKVYSLKF